MTQQPGVLPAFAEDPGSVLNTHSELPSQLSVTAVAQDLVPFSGLHELGTQMGHVYM